MKNLQTTITLNTSLKLPLPVYGRKSEDATENNEIKEESEVTKELEKKKQNKCFNSHCTISKVKYRYYNLQHIKGKFQKQVKTCKQCNQAIQNYLKENNLKFPPPTTCQICCGLNMKKWLKFYSNGEKELWICKICETKQASALIFKLFYHQENIPRKLAVNNTPQPIISKKRKSSIEKGPNRVKNEEMEEEHEEHEEEHEKEEEVETERLNRGKKSEIGKRKVSSSTVVSPILPSKRAKLKRSSTGPPSPSHQTQIPNNNANIVNTNDQLFETNRALFYNLQLSKKMEEIMEIIKNQEGLVRERAPEKAPISEMMKDANRKLLSEIKELKLANSKLEKRFEKYEKLAIEIEKEFKASRKTYTHSLRVLLTSLTDSHRQAENSKR